MICIGNSNQCRRPCTSGTLNNRRQQTNSICELSTLPVYYASPPLLQLTGLQSLYQCYITWLPSVQHFPSYLPSSSCSAQCTTAAQRYHYWSGSAVGEATLEGQRAALVPSARGDEGVDGISPRVLSGLGEITSDVIGSSIFCNRTQKG